MAYLTRSGATLAALWLGMAALADPVEGLWQSPVNEKGASIQVEVAACGAAFCGTITSVQNGNQAIVGKTMIEDMTARDNGLYDGGRVWAPDEDKTYLGRLTLKGDSLKISGCVLGGLICRGEKFSRVR